MPHNEYTCSLCKADLTGEPIQEKYLEHYGDKTHYSRLIAIIKNDRVYKYLCPDCEGTWDA
jgi:hypothetical protein